MVEHPYDDWADIYDQVYAYLTYDIPFYVQQALASGGPVLELGCGTGRVALAIAEAGIDVTGVDISPRMVEAARRKSDAAKLSGTLEFHDADMRSVRLGRRFPLVLLPFRSFQSMLTVEDQQEALATVAEHLAPGGVLAMDVFVPDVAQLAEDAAVPFHVRDVEQPESGHTFVVWGQNGWDAVTQVNSARLIIEELDPGGTMLQRFYREFDLRYTFRYELEHLLRLCGFTPETLYGDFDGGPVTEESEDLVVLARRE